MSHHEPSAGVQSPLPYAVTSLACSALFIAAMAASRITDSPFFPTGVWWILLTWLPAGAIGTALAAYRRHRREHARGPARVLVITSTLLASLYVVFVVAFFIGELMGHD